MECLIKAYIRVILACRGCLYGQLGSDFVNDEAYPVLSISLMTAMTDGCAIIAPDHQLYPAVLYETYQEDP
jgi:hypothetical protein